MLLFKCTMQFTFSPEVG